jgi:tRNA(Arg) A34 adenosine deaminase TadA
MNKELERAVGIAMSGKPRRFLLGALGRRTDGTFVVSTNGGQPNERTFSAHAEARIVRKLDDGSTIWVARVLKDGTVSMARPCPRCHKLMSARGIRTVFYTISETEYGRIDLWTSLNR